MGTRLWRTLDEALMEVLLPQLTNTTYPQYEHDCDKCKFIGQIGGVDLYKQCGQGCYEGGDEYLVRRSSEPSDYGSGMNAHRLLFRLFLDGLLVVS